MWKVNRPLRNRTREPCAPQATFVAPLGAVLQRAFISYFPGFQSHTFERYHQLIQQLKTLIEIEAKDYIELLIISISVLNTSSVLRKEMKRYEIIFTPSLSMICPWIVFTKLLPFNHLTWVSKTLFWRLIALDLKDTSVFNFVLWEVIVWEDR